ncbi:MAG: YkgJ family cysteine cluster protein, partial [Burkholderiaceae bacterium]
MADLQLVIKTEDDRIFYDMPEQSPCSNCGVCCKHFRVSFYQGELDTFPNGFVPIAMTTPVTPFLVCMQGTENGNQNGTGR